MTALLQLFARHRDYFFVWGVNVYSDVANAQKVSRQAGFLMVAITWSLTPVLCTIPLLIYIPTLSFVDAYFETVSGLTTTGATILSGIDNLPMSINLWRHELNWIAGMGIIIFAVAILPILGIGGMQLYKAETPGSVKESDLPHVLLKLRKRCGWFMPDLRWFVSLPYVSRAWIGLMQSVMHLPP